MLVTGGIASPFLSGIIGFGGLTGAVALATKAAERIKKDKKQVNYDYNSIGRKQEKAISRYVAEMLDGMYQEEAIRNNNIDMIQELLLKCNHRKKLLKNELKVVTGGKALEELDYEGRVYAIAIKESIAQLDDIIKEYNMAIANFEHPVVSEKLSNINDLVMEQDKNLESKREDVYESHEIMKPREDLNENVDGPTRDLTDVEVKEAGEYHDLDQYKAVDSANSKATSQTPKIDDDFAEIRELLEDLENGRHSKVRH